MPKVNCHPKCGPVVVENNAAGAELKAVEKKLKIGKTFVTDVDVGNLPAGTIISEDDSVRDLLYNILYSAGREVSSIAITTPPTKTVYTAGELFDKTGMVVTAYYTDETSGPVTGYTYTPSTALVTTDTKITVSYGGKSAEQAITVNEPVSTKIKIYHGLMSELPTTDAEIEALTLDQTKEKADILADGYVWKNVSPANQYMILAIPNTEGIECYDIAISGYSVACVEGYTSNYIFYHTGTKATETGYRIVYSFEEE